jgi:hypothetical protein
MTSRPYCIDDSLYRSVAPPSIDSAEALPRLGGRVVAQVETMQLLQLPRLVKTKRSRADAQSIQRLHPSRLSLLLRMFLLPLPLLIFSLSRE